jgi:enterochelin esterase-like enzyme
MLKRLAVVLMASVIANAQAQPLPRPASGRIERIAAFASRHVDARHIDVWLPADYRAGKRYRVLYMHDGQMLYDATTTWNKQAWRADAAVAQLQAQGRIGDTLIVGIWNNGPKRHAEYFPRAWLAHLDEAQRSEFLRESLVHPPQADAYLRFIVEELKPEIDRRYPTRPERESTFVAGSSMGGLISIYALTEYPQVFGGAAALSTHWVARSGAGGLDKVRNAALPIAAFNYLQRKLPPAGAHRIWTDRGDDALDSLYAPAHSVIAELLRDRGYGPAHAQARVYAGTGHNEADWAARLPEVLTFLIGAP